MDVLSKIDDLRKARGWSVNNLAMEAGLTQSTLNNLYQRHTEPKLSTLRALCAAFGITLSEFFSEKQEGKTSDLLYNAVKALSEEEKRALLLLLKRR